MYRTLAALALLLCLLTSPALADQTVTGTGDPAQDVKNVQAAVDGGGTVTLHGSFDFGRDGRVKITKGVRIIGEKGTGDPETKIRGGFWTFYCPLPVKGAPPASRGPIVAIHDIHFDGAKGTPLHFPHTGGLDLRGCTISSVIPQELPIKWQDGDTLLFQAGVVVGNLLDDRARRIKMAATGTIAIEENTFYMDNRQPDRVAGYGVMVDWTQDANISIADNIIDAASRNGIEALDNELGPAGDNSIAIDRNRIITADEGIPYPHVYGPNGIVAGWYFDTTGGANFARNNRISLSGNRIEARGESSSGMILYANDIVATCNDIIMGGGAKARGIIQTGSHSFFANNRVRGQARVAIYCHPFEALKAIGNTFAWTELGNFTGNSGQVLLGGISNVIIGTSPILIDRGKGNRVVEAKPCVLPEFDPED